MCRTVLTETGSSGSTGEEVIQLNPTLTPEWKTLSSLAEHFRSGFDLRESFYQDRNRFDRFCFKPPFLLADLSKNLWDEQVLDLLIELMQGCQFETYRQKLFSGAPINNTENRPALHVLLRNEFCERGSHSSVLPQECSDIESMLLLAEDIRRNQDVSDIVLLGIGGSSLPVEMTLQALRPFRSTTKRLHIVSNIDAHDLSEALQACEAARTLFVASSKSWSTLETLQNLSSAKSWLSRAGVEGAKHIIAVTANPETLDPSEFRAIIRTPKALGGRFSIWSGFGLLAAISVGADAFRDFLAGATEMDKHFLQTEPKFNVPVCLGLLDVWYSTFLRMSGKCVVPYNHALRRLPAYLQQLEMESNGKRVQRDGSAVDYETAAVTWGEPGTNGQHAFFQWLHQGTQRTPVEFLVRKTPKHLLPEHHDQLLANAIAQAQALMLGSVASKSRVDSHRHFVGNKPSTFLVLDNISPSSLGALLALYEHRTFVSGLVWGVNSFDQWGVELGKELSKDVLRRMGSGDLRGLDPSTAGLLLAVTDSKRRFYDCSEPYARDQYLI